MKRCSKCKQEKPATAEFFPRSPQTKDGFYYWCKVCKNAAAKRGYPVPEDGRKKHKELLGSKNSEYASDYRQKIKHLVFDSFGGKCVRCGFSDYRALQIDHINRATEARNSTLRSGKGLYHAILSGKRSRDDLQLLCANCNWIKKIENREHFPITKCNATSVTESFYKEANA